MYFMDKLPTVISCCFCCFLRAGSVLIAVVSFIAGLFLAPNVSHTSGIWDLTIMTDKSSPLEMTIQMLLGIISIMLCIISLLLLVGALCNIAKLIEIYQWGALIYCVTTFVLFLILALYCVFVHGNCAVAGGSLVALIFINIIVTAYFIIVVNSLRMSMVYLADVTTYNI